VPQPKALLLGSGGKGPRDRTGPGPSGGGSKPEFDTKRTSGAARSLNLPKSSVSRHVGRLEDRLGVRLLERSTRNVRLTEIGSSYYARCKAILSELATAEHDLALLRSDPIGTIRVSCPTGLAQSALARIVPGFLADYPLVRLQIIATNRAVDLIEEKVDLAIRARTRMDPSA
jgi:DNA-binding transcriptional LysR family regulator